MAFKTNYHHQRAERDRAKQLKKEVKLQAKKEQLASKKAEGDGEAEAPAAPEESAAPD